MREHLQMYMKNKTTHLQVSNWQREKLPPDGTHPTLAHLLFAPLQSFNILAALCTLASWFEAFLVTNPGTQVSHDVY